MMMTFLLFISSIDFEAWATVAAEQAFVVLRGAVKTKVVLAIEFFDLVIW